MFKNPLFKLLFIWLVTFCVIYIYLSAPASAQYSGIPNSDGQWTRMASGWWPGEPACQASRGVNMSCPHFESRTAGEGVSYCYVLQGCGQACLAGYSWNQQTQSCDGPPPPICVPPEVNLGNGECGLPQCGDGYITQGHINGQPICQLDCTPYGGGSPGFFNGVEGCYGGDGPSCPQGTYWGQVNGVSGCWGDGSGSGSSSSTGGDGGGNDGGSGSSSGGDGGNDGGGDGGNNGGGGNGYEGAPYDPSVPCPTGYDKTANNTCEGQGDCYPGYRSVVISQSPFYAMCMPNDPPSSSSSSSSSSTQSSASSSQSSTAGGGDSSSGGNGSSSGSGSGGGGGGSGSSAGAGDCDPTAKNYLECLNSKEINIPDQPGTFEGVGSDAEDRIAQLQVELGDLIDQIKSEIQDVTGAHLSGSGTLTDFCYTIFKKQVCFGWSRWSSYLSIIGTAIIAAAGVASFIIIMRQ